MAAQLPHAGGRRLHHDYRAELRVVSAEKTDSGDPNASWKEYFRDPSNSWDSRDKTSPMYPDFQHKTSKESLWIDGWHSPSWVHRELRKRKPVVPSELKGEKLCAGQTTGMFQNSEGRSTEIVALLRSCAKQKDLLKGIRVHADIIKKGLLEKNCYIASTLVNMYAKCGALAKAAQVLNELPVRNLVAWNALIAGYAQQGQGVDALEYFEKMQREGLSPNAVTFSCALKACGSIGAVDKGEQIHVEIVRQGLLGKDVVLGTTLVDMYAKCGALVKAVRVLDELPVRDIVSWNVLIAAYAQQGKGEEALKCFERMQSEKLFPNTVTFTCILKACGSIGAADKGEQIHEEIVRQGLLEKDMVLGTTLVDMYAKCGALAKAARVLDELPIRDVVSWSALIAGYAQQGLGEEALKCFELMQREGLSPNAVTFICLLKACGSIRAADKGEKIHFEIVRQGLLAKDIVLGNTLVDMYVKCGELAKAARVLDELPVRNVISWSALIAGYAQQGQGEEALKCFEQMQREGFSPDSVTFICILKACGSIRATDKGKQIHDEILRHGLLENDSVLGNTLIDMYARCGALAIAAQVLDELPVRTIVSWNALIAGYTQQGHAEEALMCFERMQHGGLFPNTVTFISMLKACSSIGAVDKGEQIHEQIIRQGLMGKDTALGNALVDMYARCGALAKAARVLHELPIRSVVSWNALIAGYTQQGQGEEALMCFEQMRSDGLSPNTVTFTCALKACGSIGAVDKGEQVHDEIVRKCLLGKDTVLGTSLIDMYAKCGALEKAAQVLDELPVRDVVSWSALIAGYAQHGLGEEALKCYEQMQREDLSPNAVTFVCILKACSNIGAVDKGEQLHKEIVSRGLLGNDTVLGNALVDMYVKCGAFAKAARVLDELPVRDVVSWSALIAGYAQQGQGEEALVYYERMRCEGLSPNEVTFTCILKACGSIGAVDKGEQIHDEILRLGVLGKDTVLGTTLVDMYAKCGALTKAAKVLGDLPVRDVVCWNALITGYAQHGKGEEALKCFERMQSEGLSPNTVTFTCILKACGSLGAVDKGEQIYADIARQGLLGKDILLCTTLLDMYIKCHALAKAERVLDELPVRDVVTWNALIVGYAQEGMGDEALKCYERMQNDGVSPNTVTFTGILKACSSIGAAEKGEQIHDEIVRRGLLCEDIVLGTVLVDMYSKCGALEKAAQVLDELYVRDAVSWSALIAGYAQQGRGQEALKCFEFMQQEGLCPNSVTMASVLRACSRSSLVDEGQLYFANMSMKYGVTQDVEHHTCMIDLYCRAGDFDKALAVMKKMRSSDHLPVWHSLLGSCQEWGNVKLGRLAFDNAVQIDEDDAVAYVSMTKIYADAGTEKEALKEARM